MNKIKFSSISAVNLVCPMGCENGVGGVLPVGQKKNWKSVVLQLGAVAAHVSGVYLKRPRRTDKQRANEITCFALGVVS
jgi:hypothetical protein